MNIPFYEDVSAQFLSGVALSLADRRYSKSSNKLSQERLKRKIEQAEALEAIVSAGRSHTDDSANIGSDYHSAVMKAREYFMERGVSVSSDSESRIGFMSSIADRVRYFREFERINNLPLGNKMGIAFGIELVADAGVALAQITAGIGNGVVALGESIYQAPALWLGMQAGKGVLYVKDLFRSGEEKEIDALSRELTKDGKVLEMVRRYSQTEDIQVRKIESSLPESDSKSEEDNPQDAGKRMGERIVTTATGTGMYFGSVFRTIKNFLTSRREEKQKKENERINEIRSRYDKY